MRNRGDICTVGEIYEGGRGVGLSIFLLTFVCECESSQDSCYFCLRIWCSAVIIINETKTSPRRTSFKRDSAVRSKNFKSISIYPALAAYVSVNFDFSCPPRLPLVNLSTLEDDVESKQGIRNGCGGYKGHHLWIEPACWWIWADRSPGESDQGCCGDWSE